MTYIALDQYLQGEAAVVGEISQSPALPVMFFRAFRMVLQIVSLSLPVGRLLRRLEQGLRVLF